MSIVYDKHYRGTSANKQQGAAVTAAVTTTRATETDITSQHMTDILLSSKDESYINNNNRKGGQYNDEDGEEVAPTQVWLDSRKEEQRIYLDTTRGELLSIVKHRGEIFDDTILRNLIKLQYTEGVERLAKVEVREREKRENLFRYFLEACEQGSAFKEIIQAKHDATLVPWCTNGCKYCCMYRPEWDTHVRVTTTWNGALLEDAETRAREGLTGEMIGQFNALISYAGATQLQLQLMEGHTATLYAEEQATRSKVAMMEQVLFYQQFTVRHAEKLQKWESKQYAQELRDKTLESHRDQQKLQLMHVKAFRQMNLLCTSEESSKRDAMEQIQESKYQDIINKFSYRYTEIKAQQWRTEVKVALEERDSLLKFQEETIAQRAKDYEEAQKKQQHELEREFRELRKIRKAGAGDVSPPCPRCGQVPARDMTAHRLNECPERPTQCTKCSTIIPMSKNDNHRDECPSRVIKCQHCSNYFKASYLQKVHDESRCRRVQVAIQKLKHAKPNLPLSVVPSGDVGTLLQAVRSIELIQLAFVSNLVRSTFFGGGVGGKARGSITSRTMLDSASSNANIVSNHNISGLISGGGVGGNGSEMGTVDQSSIIDVEQLTVGLVDSPRGSPRNSQDTLCAVNGSLSTEESINQLLNSSGAIAEQPQLINISSASGTTAAAPALGSDNGGGGFNMTSSPSRKHLGTASSAGGGGGWHNTVARHTNALSSGAQAVVGRYSHALALPAALALFNELRTHTPHVGSHPVVTMTPPASTELQLPLNSNNLVTRSPSVQIMSPHDGDGASPSRAAGLTTLGMAAVAPHVGVHIPVTASQALQQQILRVLTAFQNPHTVEAVHQVFMSLPRWVPPSGFAFVDSVLTEMGASLQIYKPMVTDTVSGVTTTPPTRPEDLNISTITTSDMGGSTRQHTFPHQQQSTTFSPNATFFSKTNVESISGVAMRMPAHIQPFDPAMNTRRQINTKAAESSKQSASPGSPGAPKRSSVFENRRASGAATTASASESINEPVLSLGSTLPSAKPRVHLLSAPFQPCRGYVLSGGLQALATSIGEKGGAGVRSRPGSSAVNRAISEVSNRVVSGLVLDAGTAVENNATNNNLATFTSKNQQQGGRSSIDATQVNSRPGTGAARTLTALPEAAMNAVYLTPPGTTSTVTTIPGDRGQNGGQSPMPPSGLPSTSGTDGTSGSPPSGQWVSAAAELTPVRPSYHPLYPPFLPLPPKEGSVVFITHINDVPVGKFIIKHVRGFTAHLQHQYDVRTGNTHHHHHSHHRNSSSGSPNVTSSRTKRSDSHSLAKSDDFDSQSLNNEGGSGIQPIRNSTTTAMAPVIEIIEQAYGLLVETEGLPSIEELFNRYSEHCRGDALCDMLASLLQPMITHFVDQQGINGIGQEVRIRVVATAAASYRQEVGFNAVNTVYRRRFQDHFPEGNAIDLFAAQQTVEQLLQINSSRGNNNNDDSLGDGHDCQTPSEINGVLIAYPPALAFELHYVIGCSETTSVEEYESLKFLTVSDTSQYCKPGAGQINSGAPKKDSTIKKRR